MSKYRRVTQEDRIRIKDALDAGLMNSAIADKLGFDKSTIGREIRPNSGKRGYRPKQAQRKADVSQEHRSWMRKWDGHLARRAWKLLKKKCSPGQISKRPKLEGYTRVSHERIYQYIAEDKASGGSLWKNLRYSRKRRKRRFPSQDRRGRIQNAVSIEKRTAGANSWCEQPLATWPLGARHNADFCHPYTSSERGTNENRIGILRQYLPMKSNLTGVAFCGRKPFGIRCRSSRTILMRFNDR